MINPTLLRTFCTLVEVGHFTRTADKLYMTQSGVSQHIRKLEEQTQQTLLTRQGKQFALTDAGKRVYDQGKEIIQSLNDLEQSLLSDPAFEGKVNVISPGSIGLKLYPQLLSLQAQHPKLIIDYRFAPNSSVEKAISENEADLGLMTSLSAHPSLLSEPLTQEKLLLVTPKKIKDVSWDTLQSLGFINHPDGAHHATLLLAKNYPEFQHISQFSVNGFCNQIHLILEPVRLGLGFTVLPDFAVKAFNNPEAIQAHELNQSVSESLFLCTNRERPIPNRVASVIETIHGYL